LKLIYGSEFKLRIDDAEHYWQSLLDMGVDEKAMTTLKNCEMSLLIGMAVIVLLSFEGFPSWFVVTTISRRVVLVEVISCFAHLTGFFLVKCRKDLAKRSLEE
jgi:hypothetical protein